MKPHVGEVGTVPYEQGVVGAIDNPHGLPIVVDHYSVMQADCLRYILVVVVHPFAGACRDAVPIIFVARNKMATEVEERHPIYAGSHIHPVIIIDFIIATKFCLPIFVTSDYHSQVSEVKVYDGSPTPLHHPCKTGVCRWEGGNLLERPAFDYPTTIFVRLVGEQLVGDDMFIFHNFKKK